MKFAIWQSVNFADCALGYKPGALMRQVWVDEGSMEWPSGMHHTQVLDRIWIAFQRVDEDHMPPVSYEGRSLSVGDVIHLVDDSDEERWFTPGMPVGWVEVPPIDNMACPDCNGEWPDGITACPSCGLTMEEIAERLVSRGS